MSVLPANNDSLNMDPNTKKLLKCFYFICSEFLLSLCEVRDTKSCTMSCKQIPLSANTSFLTSNSFLCLIPAHPNQEIENKLALLKWWRSNTWLCCCIYNFTMSNCCQIARSGYKNVCTINDASVSFKVTLQDFGHVFNSFTAIRFLHREPYIASISELLVQNIGSNNHKRARFLSRFLMCANNGGDTIQGCISSLVTTMLVQLLEDVGCKRKWVSTWSLDLYDHTVMK